jgi:hypothetical protein
VIFFGLLVLVATKAEIYILSPPDGAGINLNKLPASLNAATAVLAARHRKIHFTAADSVTSVRTNKIVTINPVGSDSARHVHKLLSARRTNKIGRKIISAISQERRNKTSAAINCTTHTALFQLGAGKKRAKRRQRAD